MRGIVRLVTCVNKVNCANPSDCLDETIQLISNLPSDGFDLAVFPSFSLCSPGIGNLAFSPVLTEECTAALTSLVAHSKNIGGYLIAGLLIEQDGQTVPVMAVIANGTLAGLIATQDLSPSLFNPDIAAQTILPCNTVFAVNGMRFCIAGCKDPDNLTATVMQIATTSGCDLILIPAYAPIYAGRTTEICTAAQAASKSTGCAVAVINGGIGDSSSPYLYRGFSAVYECGEQLSFAVAQNESFSCATDLDLDIIRAQKTHRDTVPVWHSINHHHAGSIILRDIPPSPFLPVEGQAEYLNELFDLQVRSLCCRMENIGVTKLVIGVSGGLDSTAALLTCAAACDRLELPRKNITGVTMPGFGTTDRTYYNALCLLDNLNADRKDIPIRASVLQHFEDIGHTGKKDTAYENAQARERAQILFDIANMIGGIVVGTGDLSELALGFCTFAGDHMSNYSVNACITKTVLRELTRHVVQTGLFPEAYDAVIDILDTPVSPELLPPGESGELEQKTEDILGPYCLHDFFLYYFIRYHFSPSKIFLYAAHAFSGQFAPEFIKEKLRLFLTRFCAGQFKRACSPDCASITQVNLLNVNFYIPSDLDCSALLRDLDNA